MSISNDILEIDLKFQEYFNSKIETNNIATVDNIKDLYSNIFFTKDIVRKYLNTDKKYNPFRSDNNQYNIYIFIVNSDIMIMKKKLYNKDLTNVITNKDNNKSVIYIEINHNLEKKIESPFKFYKNNDYYYLSRDFLENIDDNSYKYVYLYLLYRIHKYFLNLCNNLSSIFTTYNYVIKSLNFNTYKKNILLSINSLLDQTLDKTLDQTLKKTLEETLEQYSLFFTELKNEIFNNLLNITEEDKKAVSIISLQDKTISLQDKTISLQDKTISTNVNVVSITEDAKSFINSNKIEEFFIFLKVFIIYNVNKNNEFLIKITKKNVSERTYDDIFNITYNYCHDMFKYELYKSVYIYFYNGNKMKRIYIEPYEKLYSEFIKSLKIQYTDIFTYDFFNNEALLLKKDEFMQYLKKNITDNIKKTINNYIEEIKKILDQFKKYVDEQKKLYSSYEKIIESFNKYFDELNNDVDNNVNNVNNVKYYNIDLNIITTDIDKINNIKNFKLKLILKIKNYKKLKESEYVAFLKQTNAEQAEQTEQAEQDKEKAEKAEKAKAKAKAEQDKEKAKAEKAEAEEKERNEQLTLENEIVKEEEELESNHLVESSNMVLEISNTNFKVFENDIINTSIIILYKDIASTSATTNVNFTNKLFKSYNYIIYINENKIEVFQIKKYHNIKHILKIINKYEQIIIINKGEYTYQNLQTQYSDYSYINLIFIYKNIGENDINNLPKFKKIILNKSIDPKELLTIDNCNLIRKIIIPTSTNNKGNAATYALNILKQLSISSQPKQNSAATYALNILKQLSISSQPKQNSAATYALNILKQLSISSPPKQNSAATYALNILKQLSISSPPKQNSAATYALNILKQLSISSPPKQNSAATYALNILKQLSISSLPKIQPTTLDNRIEIYNIVEEKLKPIERTECLKKNSNGKQVLGKILTLNDDMLGQGVEGKVYISEVKETQYKVVLKLMKYGKYNKNETEIMKNIRQQILLNKHSKHFTLFYNNYECKTTDDENPLISVIELTEGDLDKLLNSSEFFNNVDDEIKVDRIVENLYNLLVQCIVSLATFHNFGYIHQDSHLKNFLYQTNNDSEEGYYEYKSNNDTTFYIKSCRYNIMLSDFGLSILPQTNITANRQAEDMIIILQSIRYFYKDNKDFSEKIKTHEKLKEFIQNVTILESLLDSDKSKYKFADLLEELYKIVPSNILSKDKPSNVKILNDPVFNMTIKYRNIK